MTKLLRDAGASNEIINAASEFKCPHCDLTKRFTGNVRNVTLQRSHTLGDTLYLDPTEWIRRDGTHTMFVAMADEASRFMASTYLWEGKTSAELGNEDIDSIISSLSTWCQYFRTPRIIRVDGAGLYRSTKLREWYSRRNIELQSAAGEASWQVGLIERHIKTIKEMLDDTQDDFQGDDIEDLLSYCTEAKDK